MSCLNGIQILCTLISAFCSKTGNSHYANNPSSQNWCYSNGAWGSKYNECQEAKAKPCRKFPGYNSSKPIIDPWWNLLETTTHEEIHYEPWPQREKNYNSLLVQRYITKEQAIKSPRQKLHMWLNIFILLGWCVKTESRALGPYC